MKTLYLDCGMGAAGDMLTAALLELLPDPEAFVAELNALGILGVEYVREKAVKCGITGTHISVRVNGEEEGEHHHHHDHDHAHDHEHDHDHDHDHEHDHDHDHEHAHERDHDHGHEHSHHHSGLHDIEHIVRDHLAVPDDVKEDILSVYRLIAEAESAAHDQPVEQIHFHEVGTMDAGADVTAVCLLMRRLSPDQVVASPVHVGSGHVRCAHGILPVPAPATAYLLKGIPMYGGGINGELCTPTGAALLKRFVTSFGDMPVIRTEGVHFHIVVQHQELAFLVGPGEAVAGELLDAAGVHVIAKKSAQDPADAGLALAAAADEHQHALGLVRGDQAIAHEFLQGRDVFRVEESVEKCEPAFRERGVRLIQDRKPVQTEGFLRCEAPVSEKVGAIAKVDAVRLDRQLFRVRRYPGWLPGDWRSDWRRWCGCRGGLLGTARCAGRSR